MCQGCVNEGLLSQETYDRIGAFCERWPDAEFGPAHIVLSDANVEDEHLRWCLGLTRAALSGDPADLLNRDEDVSFMAEMDWYGHRERDELRATAAFLESLLLVPEDVR